MRIWSIHPKYFDAKGLVALWRETLLAKNVLQGNTKGYKNHPQLYRFKKTSDPVACIDQYLISVYREAVSRTYNFNKQKINWESDQCILNVTQGQIHYEFQHLLKKLKSRDRERYEELKGLDQPESHPLFNIINGDIEAWEITGDKGIPQQKKK